MDRVFPVSASVRALPHGLLADAGGALTPARRMVASAKGVRTLSGSMDAGPYAMLAHPDGVLPSPRRVLALPHRVLPASATFVARSCVLPVNSAFPLGTYLGRLRGRHHLRGEGGRRNRERQGQQPLCLHGFHSSEREMSWGCVPCPHPRVQPRTPERWAPLSQRRATPAAACARGPPGCR